MNEMFVGILGHDLRNALNAIMPSAQLLERQQIVSAHGGMISVASTAEAGTAFRVELPKLAATNRPQGEATRRVLVVEDDDNSRSS